MDFSQFAEVYFKEIVVLHESSDTMAKTKKATRGQCFQVLIFSVTNAVKY